MTSKRWIQARIHSRQAPPQVAPRDDFYDRISTAAATVFALFAVLFICSAIV